MITCGIFKCVLVSTSRLIFVPFGAKKLRENVTVGWSLREQVRARLRLMVRTLLLRYKYPSDKQPGAIDLIMTQAEVISEDWVAT